MENLPLISVIVPVYNVEKYLDKCVSSIVDQTYKNLEIILVDDGSPDNCPAMCDAWAERDSRIRVIHKENGGSAQARNVALEVSRGDYIAFADSDDMMNRNMLTVLQKIAADQNADIVECGFSIDQKEVLDQAFNVFVETVYDSQMAMVEHLDDIIFRQVIWNKLYKAKTVEKIKFVEGKVIDDEFWTYRAIGNATKLVRIENKLYFYRQQDDSVMHQSYSLKRLVTIEAHIERHEFIQNKFPELYERSLVQLWFDCRYHGQMSLLNLTGEEQTYVVDYLNKVLHDFPLPCSVVWRQKPKEIMWLMLEKLSLNLVCTLRNSMRIGL